MKYTDNKEAGKKWGIQFKEVDLFHMGIKKGINQIAQIINWSF